MNVTIPLYVEERKRPGAPAPEFAVRPLFFPGPRRQSALLSRATSKLAADLRKHLDELGRNMRHEELADWCFAPEVAEHHVRARLDLRRSAPVCRTLLVTFPALGRTVAFAPALPDLWFDLTRGQSLEARAADVLTAYFRQREKELETDAVVPLDILEPPRAWVTGIELDVHPNQQIPKPRPPFLVLGGGEVVSGRQELEKVGRCLDWLYPDDLDRAILREPEVAELGRLLDDPDRRPVLLVGRRAVGKTAVVHEYVFRRVEKRGSPYARKQNVWLLAPQRLISGMSYVGQWENRLLAILTEAQKRQHVLYFDDLLGLYLAGLTSNSDLSAGHVLRPFIERRDVRVLGEITPEALSVLRERDRGLADLFHVLPVDEPPPREALRTLIEAMRQAEGRHRCTFDPAVVPAVIDLQQRYVRDLAMPGKAAEFLRQLAVKYRGKAVTREAVLDEFAARSGLSVTFLDRRRRLARKDVAEALGRAPNGVKGQPAAVEAMADVVAVAKARLNDPGRPLAAFLFLGPTGVGKTQAAKALAAHLFGDADRLVRFDMNEYVDPGSAARLVGTFAEPDGLLTSAVRRQPFCVVLLDEIEKADPSVFDLLLQVLGEGRLTDSLGRTADFGNAIVILTSNLGAREAVTSFGLRPGGGGGAGAYVAAGERFFRPEFFNRLDRIIPFRPLARDDIRDIAAGLIRAVFDRDGLRQRKCVLRVDPLAMERVVDQGFHPQFGARALKRTIEKQLTTPVAAALAALAPGTPTVISVYPAGDGIAAHTEGLSGAGDVPLSAARTPPRPPAPDLGDPEELLERIEAAVARAESAPGLAAPAAALTQGQIRPEHYRYFAVREQAGRVRRMVDRAFDRLNAPVRTRVMTGHASRRIPKRESHVVFRLDSTDHSLWRALVAAQEVNQYVADLAKGLVPFGESREDQFRQILHEAALLEAMTGGRSADRALVHVRPVTDAAAGPGPTPQAALRAAYERLFEGRYGFTCAPPPMAAEADGFGPGSELLLLEMPGAEAVARVEEGTHLFFPAGGAMWPVQVMVVPLGQGNHPAAAANGHRQARERWRSALAAGTARPEDDPWPLGPVVRVYEGSGGKSSAIDLRSGLIATGTVPTAADVRTFVLSQLPLPAEVSA